MRTHRHRILASAAIAVLFGAPAVARAQGTQVTAGMNASVDILFPPLSGAGTRPLDFGMIIPGTTSVIVTPKTPQGGEFRITGAKNHKGINIGFTLPASLAGPAGATIPLDFNGNYAALCELDDAGVCQIASYFVWNPVTTPTFADTPQRYKPGRPRYTFDQYDIYLGGRAMPAAGQRPGHYTGSIGVLLVLN
jgi:hypothetical protein